VSDEKKYTERDLVMAKREAYEGGWRDHRGYCPGRAPLDVTEIARTVFPLPKVPRPRVLADGYGWDWRVRGHLLEKKPSRGGSELWSTVISVAGNRDALLSDLLANPTEEVEAP
jgi:hypothetical protein